MTGEPQLPVHLRDLDLTEDEKTEIFRVISQHDAQVKMILDKFEELHGEAIGIEAISLAKKLRQGSDARLAESPRGQQRTAGFRPGDTIRRDEQLRPEENVDESHDPAEKIKQINADSPASDASAEIWKQLHELHLQAVKAEAEKLAAIEKVLPEDKLRRLHEIQSQTPSHSEENRPDRPDLQNADQNPEEERRDRAGDRDAGRGGVEARDQIDPNRSEEPLSERRESGED